MDNFSYLPKDCKRRLTTNRKLHFV